MSDSSKPWAQVLDRVRTHLGKLTDAELRDTVGTPISYDDGTDGGNPRLQGILTLLSWAGLGLGLLAALITAFFTQGLVLWILLGIAGISLLYILYEYQRNAKHKGPWYAGSEATAGAFLIGHPGLFEPGTHMLAGGMVVTFDPALAADGERLTAMAERLQGFYESPEATPDDLREAVEWIDSGILNASFRRLRLPESFAGNRVTWLVSLGMDQGAMPHGHIDRNLWPVFGRPEHNEAVVLVPHELWHDEERHRGAATRGVSA